jgi:hypothetical protein
LLEHVVKRGHNLVEPFIVFTQLVRRFPGAFMEVLAYLSEQLVLFWSSSYLYRYYTKVTA